VITTTTTARVFGVCMLFSGVVLVAALSHPASPQSQAQPNTPRARHAPPVDVVDAAGETTRWETERQAQERLHEKYGGELEYRLWDRARVDILTADEAIEIDFSRKWAEAIGQAKYYSYVTGRKPAIILLVEDIWQDRNDLYRCQTVCVRDGIQLYIEELKPRDEP